MTCDEAIETIEIAKAEVEWNYPMDYQIAFDTAIDALKKQIGKEPEERCDLKLTQLSYGLCKVCGDGINSEFDYCPACGNRIIW